VERVGKRHDIGDFHGGRVCRFILGVETPWMGIELNSFRASLYVTVPESLSSISDSLVINSALLHNLVFLSFTSINTRFR